MSYAPPPEAGGGSHSIFESRISSMERNFESLRRRLDGNGSAGSGSIGATPGNSGSFAPGGSGSFAPGNSGSYAPGISGSFARGHSGSFSPGLGMSNHYTLNGFHRLGRENPPGNRNTSGSSVDRSPQLSPRQRSGAGTRRALTFARSFSPGRPSSPPSRSPLVGVRSAIHVANGAAARPLQPGFGLFPGVDSSPPEPVLSGSYNTRATLRGFRTPPPAPSAAASEAASVYSAGLPSMILSDANDRVTSSTQALPTTAPATAVRSTTPPSSPSVSGRPPLPLRVNSPFASHGSRRGNAAVGSAGMAPAGAAQEGWSAIAASSSPADHGAYPLTSSESAPLLAETSPWGRPAGRVTAEVSAPSSGIFAMPALSPSSASAAPAALAQLSLTLPQSSSTLAASSSYSGPPPERPEAPLEGHPERPPEGPAASAAPGSTEPRYRIKLMSSHHGQPCGWYLGAQRSIPGDIRTECSTYASVHRTMHREDASEWIFEPCQMPGKYRIRLASDNFQQPSGWFLDVHRDLDQDRRSGCSTYVLVHFQESDCAGEWAFEHGSTNGRYKIKFVSSHHNQPAGWFLDAYRSNTIDKRSEDSSYVVVHGEGHRDWTVEWEIEHITVAGQAAEECGRAQPSCIPQLLLPVDDRLEKGQIMCLRENTWPQAARSRSTSPLRDGALAVAGSPRSHSLTLAQSPPPLQRARAKSESSSPLSRCSTAPHTLVHTDVAAVLPVKHEQSPASGSAASFAPQPAPATSPPSSAALPGSGSVIPRGWGAASGASGLAWTSGGGSSERSAEPTFGACDEDIPNEPSKEVKQESVAEPQFGKPPAATTAAPAFGDALAALSKLLGPEPAKLLAPEPLPVVSKLATPVSEESDPAPATTLESTATTSQLAAVDPVTAPAGPVAELSRNLPMPMGENLGRMLSELEPLLEQLSNEGEGSDPPSGPRGGGPEATPEGPLTPKDGKTDACPPDTRTAVIAALSTMTKTVWELAANVEHLNNDNKALRAECAQLRGEQVGAESAPLSIEQAIQAKCAQLRAEQVTASSLAHDAARNDRSGPHVTATVLQTEAAARRRNARMRSRSDPRMAEQVQSWPLLPVPSVPPVSGTQSWPPAWPMPSSSCSSADGAAVHRPSASQERAGQRSLSRQGPLQERASQKPFSRQGPLQDGSCGRPLWTHEPPRSLSSTPEPRHRRGCVDEDIANGLAASCSLRGRHLLADGAARSTPASNTWSGEVATSDSSDVESSSPTASSLEARAQPGSPVKDSRGPPWKREETLSFNQEVPGALEDRLEHDIQAGNLANAASTRLADLNLDLGKALVHLQRCSQPNAREH